MGLFDWFVAELTCRACGAKSPADGSTNAQTKLHAAPRQNYLGVGARLEVTPEAAEAAGYTMLRPPDGGEVRILQTWECGRCEAYPQWLEVVVKDGVIAAIAAVALDTHALARAHYKEEE